jgi:hypothetical protein
LPCQRWQDLAVAEWDLVAEAVAAATLVVAAVPAVLLVAALALHQLSTAVAFEEHRLSAAAAHTLPAEVLADQLSHLDSIMVVIACLPYGRRDSLVQSVGRRIRMSAESLRQIVNQTA